MTVIELIEKLKELLPHKADYQVNYIDSDLSEQEVFFIGVDDNLKDIYLSYDEFRAEDLIGENK